MSGAIENLKPEESLQPESGNGVSIGKNADRKVSDTQEYLGETLEQKKYKEQTINYWLNEIFWLPEGYKRSLRTKVDFNKRVSIKDLLREIELEDEGWRLRTTTLIILADESLNKNYFPAFQDYVNENDIRMSRWVSVEDFLEILSGFERERLQTIQDRAQECLMTREFDNLKYYCDHHRGSYNREEKIMSRKKFEELLELAKKWKLEKEGLL